MIDLSFLNNVELETVEKTTAARTKKVRLPETADIRVFRNGAVYPSKAFAEKYNLEFVPRTADPKGEFTIVENNGMDIFSSKDWGMVKGKLPQEVMFCSVIPKRYPKVDLWGSTKYDENNIPKASVLTQGVSAFGKSRLVPMLADVYGIDFETVEFVDLTVSTEHPVKSHNNIYHIPKVVMSGKHKGNPDYILRENIDIFPLVVQDNSTVVEETTDSVTQEQQDEASADWINGLGQ